jgi:hypothetical protein
VCHGPTRKLSTGNRYFWQLSVHTPYFCPSCFTAIHTGIGPEDAFVSVGGFALAR